MSFKNFIENKINLKKGKKFVSIIGSNPSKSARSPILWNRAFLKLKKNIKMFPLDVKDQNVRLLIQSLRNDDYFLASAVTLPYKEKVIKYLDEIDQTASEIGSVNLIVKSNKKLKGYNTDSFGCSFTLNKMNKKIKNILILGCGGAGKACIISTKNKYPKANIYLFNRNLKKLKKFKKGIKFYKKNIKIIQNIKKLRNLDLIINTTSLGFDLEITQIKSNYKYFTPILFQDLRFNQLKTLYDVQNRITENLIDTFCFLYENSNATIFDIIYKPNNSLILKIAEKIGLRAINGLEMNFMQAVKAFKIVNKEIEIRKIIQVMK